MSLTGIRGLVCRLFDRHPPKGHAMRFIDIGENLNMLGIQQFEKLRSLVGTAVDRSMRGDRHADIDMLQANERSSCGMTHGDGCLRYVPADIDA